MAIEAVTLDVEKIYRVLTSHEIPKAVADVIIELHDSVRTLERAMNDVLEQQTKLVQAMVLVNKGFQIQNSNIDAIKRRYSDPNREMVEHAEAKGNGD